MKNLRAITVLIFLLVGCGGGDNAAGPDPADSNSAPEPVPTAAGTPVGTPVTGTIGPGGGLLASSDGLLAINVPAGALSADTDITIQPLTNTAWGGVGAGYRLTPDGLTFSTPIDIVFEVAPEVLVGSAAEFLDVAVQDDKGFWYTLRNRVYDDGAQTLTGQTSHFTDYSMIDGVQIRPPTATVGPSGTVSLSVQVCSRLTYTDEQLAALVITCDNDLAPLGYFTEWSVNAVKGGNSTVGRVTPGEGNQVVYIAPAYAPTPNVVAVSVKATYQNVTVLLVCNITVVDQWSGTATEYYSQGTGDPNDVETAVFSLNWTSLGSVGTQEFLQPTGSVKYTVWPWPGCPQVSFTPDTRTIGKTDGMLIIDYATTPPMFSWWAATYWTANYCSNCGDGVTCEDRTISAGTELIEGTVSADGKKISGYFLDVVSGDGYNFEFTKAAVTSTQ